MTEKFKILSPREHVQQRIGMYLGSSSNETVERFVLGKWTKATYVPAVFKMINEIIDNSIDEAIRSNFKFANKIDVTIEGNEITVSDNGRGIPQDSIVDTNGEKILRPVAAWTKTNAGTSFTDDRVTIGANGVGSAATNYLSSSFVGKTWQNGNLVEVHCSNGAETTDVKQKKKDGNGTIVSFIPNFEFFELNSISDGNLVELVEDRLINLQLAFPEIQFSYNKKKISANDIKKYAELFTQDGASVIIEKTENVSFFFSASDDGFRSNSYVNGVNTYQGGSYVDFIVNNVVDELLVMIKKKHKIEISKSTIKNGLTFILFSRNFTNPKFDSQTKERLTSTNGSVKEHYETSGCKDFKTLAKKLFAADDIIEPLIAAQIAKKDADERRNALVAQKKLKKVKVAKHIAASDRTISVLHVVEGDCIYENEKIFTCDGDKAIKDIELGDLVLTHKNKFKPVISKSFSLKKGIKLNGKIYSHNHRLFVYDTLSDVFCVKETKDINIKTDKLIKNRLVYNGFDKHLHIVQKKKAGGYITTDKLTMKFTEMHEILYLTKNLEIKTKICKNIQINDIIFL